MSLLDWGWSSALAERFTAHRKAGLAAARVVGASRGVYELESEDGRARGELSGRLEYTVESALDLPVAGDWVAVTQTNPALIIAVMERQSLFTRVVDDGRKQALAANIDVAFLVCGLDHDWNPRRLDRYLVLARDAGVTPVIVLNKRDLCDDPEAALRQASGVAQAVLISAYQDDLAVVLGALVGPRKTAALLGSSGVGKSTIVNSLAGVETQAIGAVREDDSRGRHTTTERTLIRLPQNWLLLDMPGLRTVGISGGQDAVDDAFADIVKLAAGCRFANCSHTNEPGCAVLQSADPERLAHYRKLLREAAYQHRREDASAARAEKERWKKIHYAMNRRPDKRG
ncbi:MAG: ribosome small subunit-dependent GTPase A [Bryobacteraceae bacterium]